MPTRPAFLKVEISRKCSVRCKYCTEKKEDVFYPLDRYRRLVDELAGDIFLVSLYDIGEPLANPRVLEYIRYAHRRRVGTVISTSLSFRKSDEFWKALLGSGLDRMVVAIDGISEAVYKEYRTCGDFVTVMSNLQKLLRYRDELKSPVRIEWQMVDLPWNRCEQAAARRLAKRMGCDEFRVVPESMRLRWSYCRGEHRRKRNCLLPFLVLIVNAYNKVRPCYKVYGGNGMIGDLASASVREVWNGSAIGEIRDPKRIARRPHCQTCRE